jgi:cation:H+ antiporter
VAAIVWGAETFAEHLAVASTRLGVSAFALALLLAGAEPEELATAVTASLREAPAIAFGDVIGANVAICLVALGVGANVAPLPFDVRVRRYALAGLPAGALAAWSAWDEHVSRLEGLGLVGVYVAFVVTIWIIERHPRRWARPGSWIAPPPTRPPVVVSGVNWSWWLPGLWPWPLVPARWSVADPTLGRDVRCD